MAEYGREWSHRRGGRSPSRRPRSTSYGYGREFTAERPLRRRAQRHFTGFKREPGIEEGFGYGAGVGYGMEMEYGPGPEERTWMGGRTQRGYRGGPGYRVERGYPGGGRGAWTDYEERRLAEYGYDYEYGGRGWPYREGYAGAWEPAERRYRERRPRAGESMGRPYMGRSYRGGMYGPEFAYEEDFGYPPSRQAMHPRYGHTPVDRWPETGHDVDHLDADELEMHDGEIREAVLENLFQDSWIDPERIDVEVDRGVVTLTGEVRDFMEARYAWDDAWESPGVRGVVNNLTVRADLPQEGMELPQTSGEEGGRGRR